MIIHLNNNNKTIIDSSILTFVEGSCLEFHDMICEPCITIFIGSERITLFYYLGDNAPNKKEAFNIYRNDLETLKNGIINK